MFQTRPEVINTRDLQRKVKLPSLRDKKSIGVAIDVLVEAGWLRAKPSRASPAAGRQKSDLEVNPQLWEERHA